MKVVKRHAVFFTCPQCGAESDYASEITEGPHKGTRWNTAYWCDKCRTAAQVRNPWLFGIAFGPLMAMCAALAFDALPRELAAPFWVRALFAAICCAIIGWPLSRYLSRYLVFWETREAHRSCDSRERR